MLVVKGKKEKLSTESLPSCPGPRGRWDLSLLCACPLYTLKFSHNYFLLFPDEMSVLCSLTVMELIMLHIKQYWKPLCPLLSSFHPQKSLMGPEPGKRGGNFRPHKKNRFASSPCVRLKWIQQDEHALPIPTLCHLPGEGVLTWEP